MTEQPYILQVEPRPDEPCFDTFEEAVAIGRAGARARQADEDSAQIRGRVVLGSSIRDDSLDLSLSGELALQVTMSSFGIVWSVRRGVGAPEAGPKPLLLKFPGGAPPHVWDRAALVQDLMGKEVVRISASVAWVFLDVKSCPTLMFSRIWARDLNRDLLFFGPE